jgi:hypothetical protein
MPRLHLATFRVDVTPPLGHALCGGWIKPALEITDPLLCLGLVLLGEEAPVVLCALDWTGLCNEAHRQWRDRLAAATHTTPERVAVHCVHQHNAPFVDRTAHDLAARHADLPRPFDLAWFGQAVARCADAAKQALQSAQAVSHFGHGRAKVEQVASNRRLIGPDGKIAGWRASACKDAALRAAPEGLIDPWLRTVTLWNDRRKLAVLHCYATHPMSYYGDGKVTSDFVGLARERYAKEEGVLHLYFTGCSGDVAAGKYNDGAAANRPALAERLYKAMVDAEKNAERTADVRCSWQVKPTVLPPRADSTEDDLLRVIADDKQTPAVRLRAAMKLAYRRRAARQVPIDFGCLRLGDRACWLSLPAECFVAYQLFAQEQWRDGFVVTAAYGDGGPWYVPTDAAFSEGGYEPSAAFADPAETLLKETIRSLVRK